jgi:outer membrane autotransporter protein
MGSTDFNNNSLYDTHNHYNKAFWLRPYTSFENLHLKNGPRADVISYGTLIGFDTDFRKLKKGWANVGTGYIGYNGSRVTYNGTSTTMNGGLFGLTETFYKKNFWTALTLSAGASVGETHNMYGKEDFTSFLAGIASKTGYNIELKEGRYIIQPIWFMSYTFVNTFDYTNSAGVRISNDPMHTIQLNPSLRFIMNTNSKWQPYASVGMVWNLLNKTNTMANNVKLPEMRMKPYVEYGLGIQRHWKDSFCAFGQAMLRNGGRNGIALTFGFRWSLERNKGKTNIQKVKTPAVIKAAMK